MTSSLTVADARDVLWTYVCPEDKNSSRFLSLLNQARERIINSGKWHGTIMDVVFDTSRNYFTLPRDAQSLMSISVNRRPYSIQNKWYEYLTSGPGGLEDPPPDLGGVIDLGDHYCTIDDIETAGVLKVDCADADDNGKIVRLYGTDVDGNPIVDSNGEPGEDVAMNTVAVSTTNTFYSVTGVVFDNSTPRVGNVTLSVAGTPDVELSTYVPSEQRPQYRRYKLRSTELDVIGRVKLKYIPLVSEHEIIVPANIGAFKHALQAIGYEDNNDLDGAQKYWSVCYSLLNQQMKENRGAARSVPNLKLSPAGRGFPRTF